MSQAETIIRLQDRIERRDKALLKLVADLRLEAETAPKDTSKRETIDSVVRRILTIINHE